MSTQKSILIIEDEPLHSDMYAVMFEQEDFVVYVVQSGDEAVSWFEPESGHPVPDAVVLDIILPGFSGLSVLERLRSNPATKNIPVVVATNLAGEDVQKKAKALGANAFIIKAESTPRDIVDAVKKLLKGNREYGLG